MDHFQQTAGSKGAEGARRGVYFDSEIAFHWRGAHGLSLPELRQETVPHVAPSAHPPLRMDEPNYKRLVELAGGAFIGTHLGRN
jgi:hypothetical protein